MAEPFEPPQTDLLTYLLVVVFVYGTAVHVVQLAVGGPVAYLGAPTMIRWFFVALVVLDPAAAALILLRRRLGLVIGNLVLILDATANAIVNYPPVKTTPGITAGRIGQGVVTVLAIALIIVTPRLWRRYR